MTEACPRGRGTTDPWGSGVAWGGGATGQPRSSLGSVGACPSLACPSLGLGSERRSRDEEGSGMTQVFIPVIPGLNGDPRAEGGL